MTKAKTLMRLALTGAVALILFDAPATAQEATVLSKNATSEDFIRALLPPPKSRGIAPANPTTEPELPSVAVNITFEFNSANLTSEAIATLDQLGTALNSQQLGDFTFLIEGHTDSKGSASYNQKLSERRAKSVETYLASTHSIDPFRMRSVGKGEAEPINASNPEAGENRRVEIINTGK